MKRGIDIKRLRRELGLSQQETADAAGFRSLGDYIRIEQGAGNPSRVTIKKIADALGATIE